MCSSDLPDNPAKLHNNLNYPFFTDVKALLEHKKDDPFGIGAQFHNFLRKQVNYPILFIKYGKAHLYSKALFKFLNRSHKELSFRNRSSDWKQQPEDVQKLLQERYSTLAQEVDQTPDLMIRYPKNTKYHLGEKDVIAKKPKLQGIIKGLLPELKTYVPEGYRATFNAKHFIQRDNISFVNIRQYNSRKFKYTEYPPELGTHKSFIMRPSYLYMAKGSGNFKQIPYPLEGTPKGQQAIEDPRVFSYNGKNYLIATAALYINNENTKDIHRRRRMFMYDISAGSWVQLHIPGHDFKEPKEKNWTPYVHNGELHFIYSYYPMCVLKMKDMATGACEIVKGKPSFPKIGRAHV